MAVPPKNDAEAFDQPDPNDERLPEEKLNTMAVRIAFFYRVMNGCGALAFAWATVVLLGGYATLIKQKDFWFVTIIVFMEATWLHGTDQDRLPSRGNCTSVQSAHIHRPSHPTAIA
ncbi:Os01g0522600 [Oryza sativa Japonica Group]|uniref:Os01g0522600 protein n=1 Tax=Oryza sativa subsp. japonica TaxID=39947 RepID=A0A0P0V3F8_ORYSJ|nr:Os01g0522600 [Oryza sativa Japonica Group]